MLPTENNGKNVKPFICVYVPGAFQGHGGWGFGHVSTVKGGGYAWDGKAIPTTVFEIAVKSGELTEAESKKLLKKSGQDAIACFGRGDKRRAAQRKLAGSFLRSM